MCSSVFCCTSQPLNKFHMHWMVCILETNVKTLIKKVILCKKRLVKRLHYSSPYSGQLPGSCCRFHQGCHGCEHTPTPLYGPLLDRCQTQRTQPRVGQTDKQMAMRLSAWCWYDLQGKEMLAQKVLCFRKSQPKWSDITGNPMLFSHKTLYTVHSVLEKKIYPLHKWVSSNLR